MVDVIIACPELPSAGVAEAREVARSAILEHIAKCVVRPRTVVVTLDEEGWVLRLDCDNSNIIRMRRITGYLSTLNRFGSAKLAEAKDRVVHSTSGQAPALLHKIS